MAQALENPCRKIVRSFMPGSEAMLVCVAVVGQLGVDLVGDHQQVVLARERGDVLAGPPRVSVAPVGLFGKFSSRSFGPGVTFASSSCAGQPELVVRRGLAPPPARRGRA